MLNTSIFTRALAPLGVMALWLGVPAVASAQEPAAQSWPDVSGQWAQVQVTTSISKIPVVGEVESVTKALLIVTVKQDGASLAISEQICDITIVSSTKRVQTLIPAAFVRASSGTQRTAKLSQQGGVVRFDQAPKTVVLGAKLKNINDALPEDEDDPRLVDADGDGKPGLTVLVRGAIDGEVYVVQRGWNKLSGELKGDMITGGITWSSSQSTVDATSMFLKSSPTSKPDPRASKNYFRMKRLDKHLTCAQVKQQRAALVAD